MSSTAAARYKRAHAGEGPDSYWNIFHGERHTFGKYDAFEWELGKTKTGFVLIFSYWTWDDAWDEAYNKIRTEAEALKMARSHTKRAVAAFRASRKEYGKAVARDVADRLYA